MEYSFVGMDSCISATGNPNIFGNVVQLIEKLTSFILPDNEIQETSSQVGHRDIEMPPFTLGNYCTTKPINIRVQYLNDDEYIATLEEAGISFSARTATEVIQELKVEIIEVYKFYKSETALGSWPRHQLAILEKYIAEKKV